MFFNHLAVNGCINNFEHVLFPQITCMYLGPRKEIFACKMWYKDIKICFGTAALDPEKEFESEKLCLETKILGP